MPAPTILVFDSGLGGLTVFREVAAARPDARLVYLADDERFPYGEIPEAELVARVLKVIGNAIEAHKP
jgi:glutamate racemase